MLFVFVFVCAFFVCVLNLLCACSSLERVSLVTLLTLVMRTISI